MKATQGIWSRSVVFGALFIALTGCDIGERRFPSPQNGLAGGSLIATYPLDWCLVSEQSLCDASVPVSQVYEGQEFKFCCSQCLKAFNDDTEYYLEKLKPYAEERRARDTTDAGDTSTTRPPGASYWGGW